MPKLLQSTWFRRQSIFPEFRGSEENFLTTSRMNQALNPHLEQKFWSRFDSIPLFSSLDWTKQLYNATLESSNWKFSDLGLKTPTAETQLEFEETPI